MGIERIIKNIGRRALLASLLIGSLSLGSCVKEIRVPVEPEPTPTEPDKPVNPPPSQTYTNVTGTWKLSARNDFANNEYKGTMNINLDLTQTNQNLGSGIYKITGTFSDWWLVLQRKSDGLLYPAIPGGSGNIIDGGIYPSSTPPRIEFYLASSNYRVRGVVVPDYKTMWGDLYMNPIGPTGTGRITITGMWDAVRK